MDGQQQQNAQNGQGSAQQTMGNAQAQAKEAMHGLEAWLVPIFEKFPHLPNGGRDFLVMIAPWYALIFGVLGLTAIVGLLGVLGLSTVNGSAFMLGSMLGGSLFLSVVSIASAILLLMGFKGIKAKQKSGWNFLFYSEVVSVAGGVVSAVLMHGYGLVGTAIGALIGFYLIFEIRSYYK